MRCVRHLLLLGVLVLLITTQISSQTTFSKRYIFDAPLAIANSLYITDSCYYFSGIIAAPEVRLHTGLLFGRLNLNGEIDFQQAYFKPETNLFNWRTPLLYSDSLKTFLSMGYGGDSIGGFNFYYQLNDLGGLLNEVYYRSPYTPLGSEIRSIDFIQDSAESIIVLENVFAEDSNPMGLTEGGNYALRRLSLDGQFLESNIQEHEWNLFPQKVIAQDSHYLVAYNLSNGNLTTTGEYYESYGYIDKFDHDLNKIGRATFGFADDRGIYDMLPTADGGVIATGVRGSRYPFNGGTRESLRWDRGYVQKLNRYFQVSWDTEFTVPTPYMGNQSKLSHLIIAPDSSGYVATGFCTVFLEEYRRSAELGWIVKTNLQGDSLWRRFLFYDFLDSTYYEQQVYDLKATPDGGYLMCGFASERGNPVDPGQQAWFVKVDSEGCLVPNCGLVNTDEPEPGGLPVVSLQAYPNPGTDALYLHVRGLPDSKHQVQMTNAQGQLLFRKPLPLDDTTYLFDVPHYPAGTYFITILDAAGQPLKTLTWIKE